MSGTLVDSNVLLDVLTEDPIWSTWSAAMLEQCANEGTLYINPIIYAEISIRFTTIENVRLRCLRNRSTGYLFHWMQRSWQVKHIFVIVDKVINALQPCRTSSSAPTPL